MPVLGLITGKLVEMKGMIIAGGRKPAEQSLKNTRNDGRGGDERIKQGTLMMVSL